MDSGQEGPKPKASLGSVFPRSSSSTGIHGQGRYAGRQRSGGLKSLTDKILEKATSCPSKCDISPTTLKNLLNPGKFLRANPLRSSLDIDDKENGELTAKIQKRISEIQLQDPEKSSEDQIPTEKIKRESFPVPTSSLNQPSKMDHEDNQARQEDQNEPTNIRKEIHKPPVRSFSMPSIPTPKKQNTKARLYEAQAVSTEQQQHHHSIDDFMKKPNTGLAPYFPAPKIEPNVQQAALNLKKTPIHSSMGTNEPLRRRGGQPGQPKLSPTAFEPQGVAAVIPAHLLPQPVGTNGDFGFKQPVTPQFKKVNQKPFTPKSEKPEKKKWKFSTETVKGQEYLVIKPLGKGGEGEVNLVIENDSRQLFALKKVNLATIGEINRRECINEVKLLIELKNSSLVIQIHSWEMNNVDQTLKIVMEYGYCDLNTSITKEVMSLIDIKFIWRRMLLIVEKIHSKGIVHADLKPANFVWVGKILKIIDFGIASRLQTDHTSIHTLNPKGTINYICPELISMNEQGVSKMSPKSDIWALGCILYLMAYGKTPFQDIVHNQAKMMAIATANIKYSNLRPELQNSGILEVLYLCLRRDPKERPSATELLQHSFLN